MTRTSIQEYSKAVQWWYLRRTKKDKGRILKEFTKESGYHRKATIRLLNGMHKVSTIKKRGRPQQ